MPEENPEEVQKESAPPTMLLHERIWRTIQAFLSEYDALTITDAIGVLEIVKHDLIEDMSCDCEKCMQEAEDEDEDEDEPEQKSMS